MADIIPAELAENIYADIFIPLVGAYNKTQKVAPNPHEVAWAATLLNARTDWWGTNMPESTDSVLGNTGSAGRRGDPECCLKLRIPMCCKQSLVAGALAERAASPDTARTRALEKQLRTMSMSQPNAWQQWQAGLDYFWNNCSLSLMYFTYDYKQGRFKSFYENTLGLFNHPEGYSNGVQFGHMQEGIDGSATKATTEVFVGAAGSPVGSGASAPYISMFSDATRERVFWFEINGDYVQPVLTPTGGTTITYHKVTLSGGTPQSDIATTIASIIDGTGFFDPVVIDGTDKMTISASITGSLPAGRNDYTAPAGSGSPGLPTGGKIFTYTNGSPAGVSQNAIDCWQLWCAPSEAVADRWAIIYDTAGTSWLFYYNLDGGGTPPAGIVADNTVAIPVSTGDNQAAVAAVTASTIEAQGFATTAVSVGPYGQLTTIDITYTIQAPVQAFNTGTLSFGVNYEYFDELKGSDGSTLASGITGPEEYAAAWNEFKVDFEETQGNIYPYLNANINWIGDIGKAAVGGGDPCGTCALGGLSLTNYICWTGNQDGCDVCRQCSTASTSSVFRISAYPKGDGSYNTPGNIFNTTTGRQANLTPIDELV